MSNESNFSSEESCVNTSNSPEESQFSEDLAIASITPITPMAVVAFRLGRAMWKLKTIIEPLAVTNLSEFHDSKNSLQILIDAAVGRFISGRELVRIRRELNEQFQRWDQDLDSYPRHEEMAEFFEEIKHYLSYNFKEAVAHRISELDLSVPRSFMQHVRLVTDNLLDNSNHRLIYELGYLLEKGIIPEYSPADILWLPRNPDESDIEIDPILPGQLNPDSNWLNLLESRIRELEISVDTELILKLRDLSERDNSGDYFALENSEVVEPQISSGSAQNEASSHPPRGISRRQQRLQLFHLLVESLEHGLTALHGESPEGTSQRGVSSGISNAEQQDVAAQALAAETQISSQPWLQDHEPDSDSPFRHELTGVLTLKQIRFALDLGSDNTLRKWGRDGRVWVLRLHSSKYRVWTKSSEAANKANQRLCETAQRNS